MIRIDNETVVVFDAGELSTAVNDTDINYIFFGSNIQLTTGITIPANKAQLVIDGFYPQDETGVRYTFTDMNSIYAADTLGVRAASSIDLTLKNMTITGRNYYGVPYIAENSGSGNLRLTYENVTYNGPQMTYNFYGTTRYIDCDITIAYAADTSRVEEVGEVCRVELGGRVNIQHTDTDDAVFWFKGTRGQQSLTVLPDAEVTVNTSSYFMYAAFFNIIFWDPLPVTYVLQQGASFSLSTAYGISLNSTHQAASFLVESGAEFRYSQQRANGTEPTLYLNGAFTVNPGGIVYMAETFTTAAALIRFTAATSAININDPKSCVFYSAGVAALSFAQNMPFSLSGGQLNYWLTPTAFPAAGTFNDPPLRKWHKDEYASDFTMTGTTSSTVTTVSSHNFTQNELNGLPALSGLHLYDARVLSIGDVRLDINPVVDDGTPVTGTSDPDANIRVEYTAEAGGRTINSAADSAGAFTVTTPESLVEGTQVRVSANTPFLIIEKNILSQAAGELTLMSAPDLIRFMLSPVSLSPLLLSREFPNAAVEVYDTRVYSTPWTLLASISAPLTTVSGYTLPDAVVFVNGGITPLSATPIVVFTGEASDGTPTTTYCTWAAEMGILLHVTEPICASERYSAFMRWDLIPV